MTERGKLAVNTSIETENEIQKKVYEVLKGKLIDHIIFDFDDTLAQTSKNMFEIVSQILNQIKLNESQKQKILDDIQDLSMSELFLYFLKNFSMIKIPFKALKKLKELKGNQIKIYKKQFELLSFSLDNNIKVSIVTSNSVKLVQKVLQCHLKNNDLSKKVTIFGDAIWVDKSASFYQAIGDLNNLGKKVLIVGDSQLDQESAEIFNTYFLKAIRGKYVSLSNPNPEIDLNAVSILALSNSYLNYLAI